MSFVIKRLKCGRLALHDAVTGECLPDQKRTVLEVDSENVGYGDFTVTFSCGKAGIPLQIDYDGIEQKPTGSNIEIEIKGALDGR